MIMRAEAREARTTDKPTAKIKTDGRDDPIELTNICKVIFKCHMTRAQNLNAARDGQSKILFFLIFNLINNYLNDWTAFNVGSVKLPIIILLIKLS